MKSCQLGQQCCLREFCQISVMGKNYVVRSSFIFPVMESDMAPVRCGDMPMARRYTQARMCLQNDN